jgi:hypothetical protein
MECRKHQAVPEMVTDQNQTWKRIQVCQCSVCRATSRHSTPAPTAVHQEQALDGRGSDVPSGTVWMWLRQTQQPSSLCELCSSKRELRLQHSQTHAKKMRPTSTSFLTSRLTEKIEWKSKIKSQMPLAMKSSENSYLNLHLRFSKNAHQNTRTQRTRR